MSPILRRIGLPLLAAGLIALLNLTPAFAQGGYYGGGSMSGSGGGHKSGPGGGYNSGSGSMTYQAPAPSMGYGYKAAPSYHAPAMGQSTMPYGAATVYVVRPGDTLAHLAARYGVSIHALVVANPAIRNINLIFIGQRLVIPAHAVVVYGDGDHDADDMAMNGSYAAPYGYQQPKGAIPLIVIPPAAMPPMAPPPAPPTTAPPPPTAPQSVNINLVAQNLMFNMSTLTVPAGAHVTVNFTNQDSGVPHNFGVYTNSSAQEAIFKGQIITGPAMTSYTFTAPAQPGTYFFRCDVHPTMMTGQFVVQ